MEQKQHTPIEEMEFFRLFVEVGDWVWDEVSKWPPLALDTMGKQLVRAIDSVGANLVEGDGRYSDADALHFFVIARASARETRFWLQRAVRRQLITEDGGGEQIAVLTSATRWLNRLIRYRRSRQKDRDRVAEPAAAYEAADRGHEPDVESDPFTAE